MVVAVALWYVYKHIRLYFFFPFFIRSLALKPGKKETVQPPSDLRITNVALGHELADPSGRTSLKFTFKTPVQVDSDDDDNDVQMEPLSTTVLCSLTPGKVRVITTVFVRRGVKLFRKIEQSMIDLILDQDEEFVFETAGKKSVLSRPFLST
jgi:FK506-binding nuclear protein